MSKLKEVMSKMKSYDYTSKWKKLLTPEIVASIVQVHEFKGQQASFMESKAGILTGLLKIAKIQSTEASNRIEGIYTSDERLRLIALDETVPQSCDEQEIAGYRDALTIIHDSYEYIPIKASWILQVHRDLYKYTSLAIGGSYKNTDNIIAETDKDGNKVVRFQAVEAWKTKEAVEELCKAYDEIISEGKASPLIIIPMFILDFLCIHPFNDGNGRMSRLLTLLLLYKAGYIVGKYISIEKVIEQTKETYYEALQNSSTHWHENENNYEPFVTYTLGIIISTYREFQSRVGGVINKKMSKSERVAGLIETTLGKVNKREILEKLPDISSVTVQRTLNVLIKDKRIIKIGGGRYTQYIWNRDREE